MVTGDSASTEVWMMGWVVGHGEMNIGYRNLTMLRGFFVGCMRDSASNVAKGCPMVQNGFGYQHKVTSGRLADI